MNHASLFKSRQNRPTDPINAATTIYHPQHRRIHGHGKSVCLPLSGLIETLLDLILLKPSFLHVKAHRNLQLRDVMKTSCWHNPWQCRPDTEIVTWHALVYPSPTVLVMLAEGSFVNYTNHIPPPQLTGITWKDKMTVLDLLVEYP